MRALDATWQEFKDTFLFMGSLDMHRRNEKYGTGEFMGIATMSYFPTLISKNQNQSHSLANDAAVLKYYFTEHTVESGTAESEIQVQSPPKTKGPIGKISLFHAA